MPNYVTNIVAIDATEEERKEVLEAIKGKDMPIDFNKIIPMPELLENTVEDGLSKYLFGYRNVDLGDIDKVKSCIKEMQMVNPKWPKDLISVEQFVERVNIMRITGYASWYPWCILNWGTKWNASKARMTEDGKLRFDTAWNAPYNVMSELSRQFDVAVDLTYADEDASYNCAKMRWEHGFVVNRYIPTWGHKSGYDLYFEVNPGMREYYELVDGEYVYKEE